MKVKQNIFQKSNLYYFVFSAFSLILVSSLFFSGYVLTLDMIFADGAFSKLGIGLFYGLSYSFSYAPFIAFLGILNIFIPAWIIQKSLFFLIFFISGISAYRLCPEKCGTGRYFAGFMYMLNPFVYVRFLAGHWLILIAYAITPFAVRGLMDFFEKPTIKKTIYAALLLTSVFVIETHTPFLLLIFFSVLFAVAIAESRKNPAKIQGLSRSAVLLGFFLLILNSYWLIPGLIGNTEPLGQITTSDLYAFTTTHDLNFNTMFTVASMYGFWRGGYIYTKDLLPYWYLFFTFILFLAVHGFISNYKNEKNGIYIKAFAAVAVLSALLAAGISGPFAGAFEFLFNNLFFFKGFREPQKFVALLVLAYAYLGCYGLAEFEKMARGAKKSTYRKTVAWIIIAIALLTPLVYSFTMFNGFWGQLKPADYPQDWYEVNEFLNTDRQDFNILFLPWHLYMDFKWIPGDQKRIANPASIFFDKSVIQGDNMEVGGIYSSSTRPSSRFIESLLKDGNNMDDLGRRMIPLDIKYVLLAKEVDYKKYFFLFNQSDLELIKETENLYVFRNKHAVSRLYQTSYLSEPLSDLEPLNHTQESPVEFSTKADSGYIVFVPPNLDSAHWEFNGKTSITSGFYAAYPSENGRIYYTRFNTFLIGYLVSFLTLIWLVAWYRKET